MDFAAGSMMKKGQRGAEKCERRPNVPFGHCCLLNNSNGAEYFAFSALRVGLWRDNALGTSHHPVNRQRGADL